MTTGARSLAAAAGVKVTQAVADQVEATLTAAMVDERCAEAVRSGLLVTALASTGVDEVDLSGGGRRPRRRWDSAPRPIEPGPPDLHVVPDPDADEKAVAAARERVRDRGRGGRGGARRSTPRPPRSTELEARAMQLQAEIEEAAARLTELEASSEQVEEELADAEDVRAEAEAAARLGDGRPRRRPRRRSPGSRADAQRRAAPSRSTSPGSGSRQAVRRHGPGRRRRPARSSG